MAARPPRLRPQRSLPTGRAILTGTSRPSPTCPMPISASISTCPSTPSSKGAAPDSMEFPRLSATRLPTAPACFPSPSPQGESRRPRRSGRSTRRRPPPLRRARDGTPKMIDFIFGVKNSQHWHSLNMRQHRDHYSSLATLGSGVVAHVQDRWGAGIYYNPYVVVNRDTHQIRRGVDQHSPEGSHGLGYALSRQSAAQARQDPPRRRDDPSREPDEPPLRPPHRPAPPPPKFTELELYLNHRRHQLPRRPAAPGAADGEPYAKVTATSWGTTCPTSGGCICPLIETLPNVEFDDPACETTGGYSATSLRRPSRHMDPVKRGNLSRRLPKAFRSRLYFQYQKKLRDPAGRVSTQ